MRCNAPWSRANRTAATAASFSSSVWGARGSSSSSLAEARFDAVLVCVPPHLHTEVCVAAAEAGSHLFIEKPLAMTQNGLEALDDLCRAKGVVGFVAYCYRFIPSVEKVKALVD
ncbi:MAG: Gfo/Idh/MocA family oxidoreductase, partial [Planctomycetes bacterium]|nr:Gfo/Idh/MocA family oxidoreductase [Planctomycetota bacterium]